MEDRLDFFIDKLIAYLENNYPVLDAIRLAKSSLELKDQQDEEVNAKAFSDTYDDYR